MELLDALTQIKKRLKGKIIESKHFVEKCEERDLDIEVIRNLVNTNKILGIIEQREDLYKIWLLYKPHKDLNIIIKLMDNGCIKFITIFPTRSERRKR